MNNQIKEQLNKCRVATIPRYEDDTTEMVFPKQATAKDLGLEEGKCYQIQVDDYIIRPFSGFTLHDNWNKGIAPTDALMNVEVLKVMGKMVQLNAIGVNDKKSWQGWIPTKSMTIIEELK